jgi:hypothetical protein
MMASVQESVATACVVCGIPLDSQKFDVSGLVDNLQKGRTHRLARFELPPCYCGVLEYFSQFTDEWARHPDLIETPGFDWSILINGRPLSPYQKFDRILNPWGFGSFETSIRLSDNSVIEFVVRQTGDSNNVTKIGGRLVGRYWYNSEFGDVGLAR